MGGTDHTQPRRRPRSVPLCAGAWPCGPRERSSPPSPAPRNSSSQPCSTLQAEISLFLPSPRLLPKILASPRALPACSRPSVSLLHLRALYSLQEKIILTLEDFIKLLPIPTFPFQTPWHALLPEGGAPSGLPVPLLALVHTSSPPCSKALEHLHNHSPSACPQQH